MLLGVPSGDPPPAVEAWLRARMREAVPASVADVRAFVETAVGVRVTAVSEAAGGFAGGRTFLVDVAARRGYVVKLAPAAPLAPPAVAAASAPAPARLPTTGPFADDPAATLRRGAVVARRVADATSGSVPVPTPVVVADAGEVSLPTPVVVAERLPGGPLGDRVPGLPPATRVTVARQVGRAVGAVHRSVRFGGFGALAPVTDRRVAVVDPAAWSTVVVDGLRPLAEPAAGTSAEAIVDRAFAAVVARRDLLDSVPGAALVHGDLRLDNRLAVDGTLTGVLDWDLAAAGDPAVDVYRVERALLAATG